MKGSMRTLKNEMNENQTVQGGSSLKKVWTSLKTWLMSFLHRLWRAVVKEVKAEAADRLSDNHQEKGELQAAEELMQLYRAWLGYLLSRLDESEVRVPVADISRALAELSCVTVREGDDYVIHIQKNSGEVSSHAADHADEGTDGTGCEA